MDGEQRSCYGRQYLHQAVLGYVELDCVTLLKCTAGHSITSNYRRGVVQGQYGDLHGGRARGGL